MLALTEPALFLHERRHLGSRPERGGQEFGPARRKEKIREKKEKEKNREKKRKVKGNKFNLGNFKIKSEGYSEHEKLK